MNLDLSPTNLTILVIVVLVTLYICVQSCLRNGLKKATIVTECLRFLLILLATLTLFQPTFVTEHEPEGQSVIKILIDDSNSMTTVDIPQGDTLISRAALVESAALAKPETWNIQTEKVSVEVDLFAAGESDALTSSDDAASKESDPFRSATNLDYALDRIASSPGEVRAVVLVSDGDWNTGGSPSRSARKLRQLEIPVHTIATGNPTALPDLALVDFDLPALTVIGKALRIPFAIKSTLTTPIDTEVTISLPDGDERTVPLQIPAGGYQDSAITWEPQEVGSFEITVQVPEHPDEQVSTNNSLTLPIRVRHESLNVLLVDSYPRWEYRFTRNAFMRDPGVTVNTVLLHPDIQGKGEGAGYLEAFPSSEKLSKYDVIFLGDVGIGEGQLTPENAEDLAQLVRNHAAGLVLLPGFRGYQSSFADSPLEELLPVELDLAEPKGVRSATPESILLTTAGQKSLLTKLDSNEESNIDIWNALPGFNWHASTVRARPNTNVLAVHKTKTNRFGRLPLIVTRTFGTGKVLFVGTDAAWRWRRGVEDRFHYRFWSQMVRWMSYQRTMASTDGMRVIFSPDRPRAGDTVNLLVNVMDSSGEPLQNGTVSTQVLMPSGKTKTLSLKSDGEQSWGLFRASFVADEGGVVKMTTTCRETGGKLETQFDVIGVPLEQIGQPARLAVLSEISAITQGQATQAHQDDLDSLLDTLRAIPPPEPLQQYHQLWSHPLWAIALIILLGVFWTARKLQGLI